MTAFQRILLPTDCSDGAEAAAEVAGQLASQLAAAIDIVIVVDTSAFTEIYGDKVYREERITSVHNQARLDAERYADRHFRGRDRVKVHVRDGNVFLQLLEAARDLNSDLIVMGTHGRTGLAHLVIGSTAEKVVRASTIPVMTVRAARQ